MITPWAKANAATDERTRNLAKAAMLRGGFGGWILHRQYLYGDLTPSFLEVYIEKVRGILIVIETFRKRANSCDGSMLKCPA